MPARTPIYWQSKNVVSIALWPLSILFRVLVACRRLCYQSGIFERVKVDVPVIVIGNITAGGAGKTPLVIALARYLQTRGAYAGILCGGYGGTARGGDAIRVDSQTDATVAGDEAVLIARQTGLPVVVSQDRAAGAALLQTMLQSASRSASPPGHICIICDDGLQHYRLHRDIEVVVVDTVHRFGNGLMLPAGPLREPVSRLDSVSVVCYSGEHHPSPGYELQADVLVNLQTEERISTELFEPKRVRAIAGIAYPDKFFNTMRKLGFEVVECALPDHHRYDLRTLQFDDDLPIIMTEKDSVKCQKFAPQNSWYLAVNAMPDDSLLEQFEHWAEAVKSD